MWKGGLHPVEKGSEPCGNGSINWFFLFQLLTYPLPTCTILSQAAEKYDSKMFIPSKIMGNREDYGGGFPSVPFSFTRNALSFILALNEMLKKKLIFFLTYGLFSYKK